MTVAVTGASGHIGINILALLLDKGYQVRVLVHKNAKAFETFDVTPIQGDILDKKSLVECIDGAEIVIHLAGKVTIDKKSEEALKINVEGTRNLLEVSRELSVKKFIFFSSITSMPVLPLERVFNETRALNFSSPFDYERSKAFGEEMVMAAAEEGPGPLIAPSGPAAGSAAPASDATDADAPVPGGAIDQLAAATVWTDAGEDVAEDDDSAGTAAGPADDEPPPAPSSGSAMQRFRRRGRR